MDLSFYQFFSYSFFPFLLMNSGEFIHSISMWLKDTYSLEGKL